MNFGARGENPKKVIGVIEDFHFKHLHDQIDPLVMFLQPFYESRFMALKLKSSNLPELVSKVNETWKRYFLNMNLNINSSMKIR